MIYNPKHPSISQLWQWNSIPKMDKMGSFCEEFFNQRITRLTLSKLTSDYRVARTYATLKTNSARPWYKECINSL
jgi:hypothetical protein